MAFSLLSLVQYTDFDAYIEETLLRATFLDPLAGFQTWRILHLIWRESQVAEKIIVIGVGASGVCLV